MSKMDYFYKTKFVKMGRWGGLLPLDCYPWHDELNSKYFKQYFEFYKGTLILFDTDNMLASCYFPAEFINKFHKYIDDVNQKNYKSLEKLLLRFYKLRDRARKQIPANALANYSKANTSQLIKAYRVNRDWAHRIVVYDQFGWIGEEYWPTRMEKLLTEKYAIAKDSPEYFRVLFLLTKPEKISTTLSEKRAVLEQAIKIKIKKTIQKKAAGNLAKKFGWMPVFAFGIPWDERHYKEELPVLVKSSLRDLKEQYEVLKNYSVIRKKEIKEAVEKYQFTKQDLQLFIDFGLALDARNEAEYILSLCGFNVLPIYKEISRRLMVTVKQLRLLSETEVVAALKGKVNVEKIITGKKRYTGWGFESTMKNQIDFSGPEAEKLLKYLDKNTKNIQGNVEGQGVCASPGKVTGTARIVTSPERNFKVKQGDILITEATTVDYLPAMKRAAAFVTEVGGLTCHAAVVSREFGVPCVVGFKNATRNFKDGDLVEVDADRGIVRKII